MRVTHSFTLLFVFLSLGLFAEEKDPYIMGKNQFCWKLVSTLEETTSNVCISPYNIASALELAYLGSEGTTKAEIGQTLVLPMYSQEILCTKIQSVDAKLGPNVTNAKAIAVDVSYRVSEAYLQLVKHMVKADLFDVDFVKKPVDAAGSINKWVFDKTNSHIKELIKPENITPFTRLVLLSAIYLKANWQNPFETHHTSEMNYRCFDGTEKKVPMMYQKQEASYFENHDVQVVWRDFERQKDSAAQLQALIVLPRQKVAFDAFVKSINTTKLDQWKTGALRRYVELFMPQCSLKQRQSVKKPLMAMGMKQPFSRQADFFNISPKLDIAIEDVIHEAYMQIDEAGVEAAGATGVTIGLKSFAPIPNDPVVVRCNRPFIVIIQEKSTNLVLFVAVVCTPEKVEKK